MFASEIDRKVHETIHTSLREIMIPAQSWLEYVSRFETVFNVPVSQPTIAKTKLLDETRGSYMVPYSYDHPVYVEMLHERHPYDIMLDGREVMTFSKEEMEDWQVRLYKRIEPYLGGRITDDVLSELDSMYDTGIIVHLIGGRIFPFLYTEVKDFEFTVVPDSAVYLMAQYVENSGTATEEKQKEMRIAIRNYMNSDSHGVYMYYRPLNYGGKPSEHFGTFTWNEPIEGADADQLIAYMRNMFNMHAKCYTVM